MVDKAFWQQIIDDNYRLPQGHKVMNLTAELLSYLPSTDPLLRDTFAYGILARWIILYGYHGTDDLIQMADTILPWLNEGLGQNGNDTVFKRSYTALILSLIAYRDSRMAFLSEQWVYAFTEEAQRYLRTEQDHRAYVTGKGWANACAHTADWLKFLAYSRHLDNRDLQDLLNTLAEKVMMPTQTIYTFDEDDRLAKVALVALTRDDLTQFDLLNWLEQFGEWKRRNTPQQDYDAAYHPIYQNIKLFLRSLYAQLHLSNRTREDVQAFTPYLLDTIKLFSL